MGQAAARSVFLFRLRSGLKYGTEKSTLASASLTCRPATAPAYGAPSTAQRSCRQLGAACSHVEAADLMSGPWAGISLACAGGGADPGSRQCPGHRAPDGRCHRNVRVERVKLVGLRGGCGVLLGDCSLPSPTPTPNPSTAETGWLPPEWPVDPSPVSSPLAAVSASLFSARMSRSG